MRDTFVAQGLTKRLAKFSVAIHDQTIHTGEKPIFMISDFSSHLFHPSFAGTGRAFGEMNTVSFEFHDKEQSYLSVSRPEFDGGEFERPH